MNENSVYNDFLNSADIIIGMSGGEGFALPEFQSVALGKHAVLLNAHSYQSWATGDMANWVQPTRKIPVYDGQFFVQGRPYNQGDIFDWNEDDFISACENAAKNASINRKNVAGLSLQTTFSKELFVKSILNEIKS
jgi:hypothetical protein